MTRITLKKIITGMFLSVVFSGLLLIPNIIVEFFMEAVDKSADILDSSNRIIKWIYYYSEILIVALLAIIGYLSWEHSKGVSFLIFVVDGLYLAKFLAAIMSSSIF